MWPDRVSNTRPLALKSDVGVLKMLKSAFYYIVISHNLGRSSGTTDAFATIPFHLVLFSATLVELA